MTIRKIALCTAAMLIAATGFAEARPDTRKMTCEQAQALIRNQNGAVLTTGQNTYDRYVQQFSSECYPQVPTSAYVNTSDGPCPLYRCEEPVGSFTN
ncbi:hypothetical protein LGH82_31165 [Mesorhizobium sp. PAMC28654]|uniref:hypothetical protein n=1 Tax=Mesorhizobium sp. PAMC28654 TaxID=2880934 RepID=UPI001D0AB043|nr:hypothetical protein [Mesorhizobium sp. PAMC28654]UDL89467.1 hypothetical protein LGH82_31165 [Mesorhizobium sp. PAMC28654]